MSIYDTHKPAAGEGGGLYLKIKDGETVKLRFASEPAIFEAKGDRDGKETLTTRYGWVVFNQDTKVAQVLQQSSTFYKNLAALAQDEEWGDPTGYDIKISRQGSDFNNTIYTITPSANREPLDSGADEQVRAIDLLEMLKKSPFNQRVMWLSAWDEMAAGAEQGTHAEEIEAVTAVGDAKRNDDSPGKAKARATAEEIRTGKKEPEPDVVIEDIGDGPVNLDDIPF